MKLSVVGILTCDLLLRKQACTEDFQAVSVRQILGNHPDWLNRRSATGETCLHLTGIYGNERAAKFLLAQSTIDVNIRSTYAKGLRMHPLSFCVYGGHLENARLLLEAGADVNLDVDGMEGSRGMVVTPLDIVSDILEGPDKAESKFKKMKELLLEFGGKHYADIEIKAVDIEEKEL